MAPPDGTGLEEAPAPSLHAGSWLTAAEPRPSLASSFRFVGSLTPSVLWRNGYRCRRGLTVPPAATVGTAEIGAFVLLFQTTQAWLRHRSSGGDVESELGWDIRFEQDGKKLVHEIERYEPTTGRLVAWVRLPVLRAGAANGFHLYYGRPRIPRPEEQPSTLWGSAIAVWNARTGMDRSGNGRLLKASNIGPAALLGDAGRYRGNSRAALAKPSFFNKLGALTVQIAIRADADAVGSERGPLLQGKDSVGDDSQGIVLRYSAKGARGAASRVIVWSVRTTAGVVRLESAAGSHSTARQFLTATWTSGTLPRLFINGTATTPSWVGAVSGNTARRNVALTGQTKPRPEWDFLLGASSRGGADQGWLGLIDEVRILPNGISAQRVANEAKNWSDPAAFCVIGERELPSAPGFFSNGFAARARIVVPKTRISGNEPFAAFLLWIDETRDELRSSGCGGRVESRLGWDIRFEDMSGNRLPHAVEVYVPETGRLAAWVRVPVSPASDTQIFLYISRPGLARSEASESLAFADYLVAWDLRSGADRTGRGRDLEVRGGVAAGELMGGAVALDGVDGELVGGPCAWLAGLDQLTLQMWAEPDAAMIGRTRGFFLAGPGQGHGIDHTLAQFWRPWNGDRTVSNPIFFHVSCGAAPGQQGFVVTAADSQKAVAQMTHATWASGSVPRLFLNGAELPASESAAAAGTTAALPVDSPGPVRIGRAPHDPPDFPEDGLCKGLIDEVRIRPVAMSAGWIATEHANQSAPGLFYGMGAFDWAGDANQSPVALPLVTGGWRDTPLSLDLAAASVDPEGRPLTLREVGIPVPAGSVVIQGKKAKFVPAPGHVGPVEFTYTLSDAGAPPKKASSRVRIEVLEPPARPELPSPLRLRQVASDAQLTAAIADCLPGDHIVLNGGPYTLASRTFARSGTEANPIVFRAATPLGVTVKGASWYVSGSRLIFHGLRFEGGQNIIRAAGFDNIVRRCDFSRWHTQAIRPYNGHDGTAPGGRWTVDYCSFHDPLPWDVPPGTEPQPSRVCIRARSSGVANFPYGWKIRRCHFYNGIAKLGPGYYGQTDFLEWPGDGPSHENLNDAGWLCEYVLIESHVGKDAVWDLKCGGNTLRHVTVLDCPGGRLDNRVWRGNRFEGIWLENCGGMDFNSGDHVANGVRMLGGAKLQIIAGSDDTDATDGANPMFQRARNVRIIGAVGGSIAVGYKYSTSDLPALNCRIEASSDCQIRTQNAYGAWATPLPASHLETGTTWSAVPSEPVVTPVKMTTAMVGNTAPWQD